MFSDESGEFDEKKYQSLKNIIGLIETIKENRRLVFAGIQIISSYKEHFFPFQSVPNNLLYISHRVHLDSFVWIGWKFDDYLCLYTE